MLGFSIAIFVSFWGGRVTKFHLGTWAWEMEIQKIWNRHSDWSDREIHKVESWRGDDCAARPFEKYSVQHGYLREINRRWHSLPNHDLDDFKKSGLKSEVSNFLEKSPTKIGQTLLRVKTDPTAVILRKNSIMDSLFPAQNVFNFNLLPPFTIPKPSNYHPKKTGHSHYLSIPRRSQIHGVGGWNIFHLVIVQRSPRLPTTQRLDRVV